jgi:hypothetical protein
LKAEDRQSASRAGGPAVIGLSLLFLSSWAALTRLILESALNLLPAVGGGDAAAIAASLLLWPLAVHLAQGLFYLPRRPSGPALFLRESYFLSPLVWLPVPARSGLEIGPAFEAVTRAERRAAFQAEILRRARLRPATRLACLLAARSPLDLCLRAWGPSFRLLRGPYLLLEPTRLFLRLWGYFFFLAARKWEDPGPESDELLKARALALDWARRAGNLFGSDFEPAQLRSVGRALARVYDAPDYGLEIDGPGLPAARPPGPIYREPWLAPRYRGAYLDQPVCSAVRTFDELYDQGPEDDPGLFYPPELGAEMRDLALLAAERERLAAFLADRAGDGFLLADGRPRLSWETEADIRDLDYRLQRYRQRLASHHRRVRSSHLAAARRWGRGWPEALTAALGRLYLAERGRAENRPEALGELLRAEAELEKEEPGPAPAVGPVPESALTEEPAGSEALPGERSGALWPDPFEHRIYSAPERLRVGFGRVLAAAGLLALLIWQSQGLGLSRLTVYNGLGRDLTVRVEGRTLDLKPFDYRELRLRPGRRVTVAAEADGLAVERFTQNLDPRPGAEVYNIAGASPLMEWTSPAAADDGGPVFLGRPRWLRTSAELLFRRPSPGERKPRLVLSGYGDLSPAEMLAAFEGPADREELIRLHARWDRPGSPWFWRWQILATALPNQADLLLSRLQREPDYLGSVVRWLESGY